MAGWAAAHLRRVPTAFWVEVTFDSWVHRSRLKDATKRQLFSHVDGIITAGPDGRAYAERHGANPAKIFEARHSIDVEQFTFGAVSSRPTREITRAELGLTGCVFIYVGRLWEGKGLPYLLQAFKIVQQSIGESSLLIVGDGPDEQHLKALAADLELNNVVFTGFRHVEALPALYTASDVFVFPTLGDPYGLVVDEAMACGLPAIITTSTGEGALRVSPDVNGYIVPPADPVALADRMMLLASDPGRRADFGAASERMIAHNTPDHWACRFEEAVFTILNRRANG
jgi:glycosyltransferase involved in cell wall biosynthesis